MNRIAVDLLWLRPGGVGGTEVVTRNLLDGLLMLEEEFHFVLITSQDNEESFRQYAQDPRFEILTAPVLNAGIAKRIMWQNLHMNTFLRKHDLRVCFSPVYDRPFFNGGIRYVTTIHDIQAYHYPQYHPFHEVVYSKWAWMSCRDRSLANVVISEHVKQDLVKIYHFKPEKMKVIYDPVTLKPQEQADFAELAARYGIQDRGYYYAVGQLIPHKNIETILKVMQRIRQQGLDKRADKPYCSKLLITGIRGNAADSIRTLIQELGIEDMVELTGYLENPERNTLYAHAQAFLFPSVFEGFGIPPIEAMILGTPVITTRCTCIPEVTQELAEYVEDPYDVDAWIRHMEDPLGRGLAEKGRALDLERYDQKTIAASYLHYLQETLR